MPTKSLKRFGFQVAGKPRSIVSFGLQKRDGGLTINLKPARMMRASGHLPQQSSSLTYHNKTISEQKYSVHPTNDNPTINVIKQTIRLMGDAEPIVTRHHTRALKLAQPKLVLIYTKRCPDLSDDRYVAKINPERTIILDNFESGLFTPIFAVLVGLPGSDFVLDHHIGINIHEAVIGAWKVFILWTFVPLPSHTVGHLMHFLTGDPEVIGDEAFSRQSGGLTSTEALVRVGDSFAAHIEELRNSVLSITTEPVAQRVLQGPARFYKSGRAKDFPFFNELSKNR